MLYAGRVLDLSRALVIANPVAGGGRVGRRWTEVCRELRAVLGADLDIARTERPDDARRLAKEAVWAAREIVLSLGGDGTHSEVAAGLLLPHPARGSVVMGALHAGTGGDFSRMLSSRGALVDQAERLLRARPATIDLARATFTDELGERRERVFLNECSAGLSGLVCALVGRSTRRLGGRATYFVNSLRARLSVQPCPMTVAIDGQTVAELVAHTAMISNGQHAGGGMHFAPEARMDDGLLDLTLFEAQSLPRMVGIAPKLYTGRIADCPGIHTFRGVHVTVEAQRELIVEADGDVVGRTPLSAIALPGALRMLDVRPEVLCP